MSHSKHLEDFCLALEGADLEKVRQFLQSDPSLAKVTLSDGWPVFLLQSTYPLVEIIELMVKAGADPNSRSAQGESLLHLTADPQILRKLVELGADINALDHQGRSPMMGHAPYAQTASDAIYTLLALGADPFIKDHQGKDLASLLAENSGIKLPPQKIS